MLLQIENTLIIMNEWVLNCRKKQNYYTIQFNDGLKKLFQRTTKAFLTLSNSYLGFRKSRFLRNILLQLNYIKFKSVGF